MKIMFFLLTQFIFFPLSYAIEFKNDLDQFMYNRNLKRDSLKCEGVETKEITWKKKHIKGTLTFMDTIEGKYEYDVEYDGKTFKITTKIFLRNVRKESIKHTPSDLANTEIKIREAIKIWNDYVPEDFPLEFDVEIVDHKSDAYFRPALINKLIEGPYYAGWSTNWNYFVIAHEIGHMFGLDDEYENSPLGQSSKFCDHSSLMCTNAVGSSPKYYNYYTIFNRLFCNEKSIHNKN